jgi:catechol 2,3-dioxygenase-like lactoylglutathione lyase family enzyme
MDPASGLTGSYASTMAIRQLDHVGVVVHDLDAARAFFLAIGLEQTGAARVSGAFVDAVIGLEGADSEVVGLRAPGGTTWLELTRFTSPPSPAVAAPADPSAPGLRHLAFELDDLDTALAAVRGLGYDLVGTVERYEDVYRLCYVRGPEGLLVELAQRL